MKRKALIIGALPSPIEGPWVRITERKLWRAIPDGDYGGCVIIEIRVAQQNYGGAWMIKRICLDGADSVFSGHQARAIITEAFKGPKTVSVVLEEVRKQ